MRTILMLLVPMVALSTAGEAMAEAKNLSCITDLSPNEQRLLRDCGPKPEEIFYVYEMPVAPPPPPSPPLFIKNGEGGKGRGAHGHDQDHDAPAGGGDPGGPSF